MIVPDKDIEAFLDRPADSQTAMLLCRFRLLKPTDYLRAVAVFRDESRWREFAKSVFHTLFWIAVGFAVLFGVLANWGLLYRPEIFAPAAVALTLCAVYRTKFLSADIIGVLLIGGLVFLPDIVFATGTRLYVQLAIWAVAAVAWEASGRGNYVSALILAETAAVVFGTESLLPHEDLTLIQAVGILSLFNLAVCAVAGFFKKRTTESVALTFALISFLILPVYCVLDAPPLNAADWSFPFFGIVAGVISVFYRRRKAARAVLFAFFMTGGAVLILRLRQLTPINADLKTAIAGLLYAFFVLEGLFLFTNGKEPK